MNLVSQMQGVLESEGAALTEAAVLCVHEDVQTILMDEEQLVSPDMIGSGLGEALRLKPSTVFRKIAMDAPFPMKPRVRTRSMMDSIANRVEGLDGAVFVGDGDTEKVMYQQRTRPFFGVSDRADQKVEDLKKDAETRIVQAINGLPPEQIDITI